jgi:hypothetical protein
MAFDSCAWFCALLLLQQDAHGVEAVGHDNIWLSVTVEVAHGHVNRSERSD